MINIKEKRLKGYKFIDLFCGIGGFHIAFSSFGAKCVFASDIDDQAKKVYEKNFKTKVFGDITKISPKDIPQHDIICAGFPCQAFSISGKKNGFKDEKGRGELYKSVVNIARFHKPKFIFLENVKNLETHDNGNTLNTIVNSFNEIGYTTFYKVLNASDYGIPQARKRIYFICIRNDLNIKKFDFPDPLNKKISLKDVLEKGIDRSPYEIKRNDIYLNDNINKRSDNNLIRIGRVAFGRQGERIYSIEGHSITLSSQGGGVGGKTGMYLIDGKIYKLTGRECARLMGFPDKYKIADTSNLCYEQFGNSVVVDVLQHIILRLVNLIGE